MESLETNDAVTPKTVVLGGYYGFENFGDELILQILIYWLRQHGAEPVVLSADPIKTAQRYKVKTVLRTSIPGVWQAFRQANGFIIGGGGLFQDKTGLGSPIYYGGLMGLAWLARRSIAFFGQGIGPLQNPLSIAILSVVARLAKIRIVRDEKSRVLLHSWTGQPVQVMGDIGWQVNTVLKHGQVSGVEDRRLHIEAPASHEPHGVGVSLRPWPVLTPAIIEHLAQQLAQCPPVQTGGVNLIDCQAGVDIQPLAKLETALKQRGIGVRWFHSHQVIEGALASQGLIGMRFHACLVAAALGRPVIGLAYDPKVVALMEQLQTPALLPEQWQTWSFSELYGGDPAQAFAPNSLNLQLTQQSQGLAQQGFDALAAWLKTI